MNSQVNRLAFRILGLELVCSVTVFLILSTARWLLALEAKAADASAYLLGMAIVFGGLVAPLRSLIALRRYRFLLRALALGSSAVEVQDLVGLSREAFYSTLTWLLSSALFIVMRAAFARPDLLDQATTIAVCSLALLVVSAAALPLYAALRATLLGIIELAPAPVMREIVAQEERSRRAVRLIRFRLTIAVAAPVAFVTLGSTLVVSSHIRRFDEQQREATALAVARSAFEDSPGSLRRPAYQARRRLPEDSDFKSRGRPSLKLISDVTHWGETCNWLRLSIRAASRCICSRVALAKSVGSRGSSR